MGSMHNTRILRFLAVLCAVVVTIFIYASYSTNTTLTPPPPHMHAGGPAASYQRQLLSTNASKVNAVEERSAASKSYGNSGNSIHELQSDKIHRKLLAGGALGSAKKAHRVPTIDADADDVAGVSSADDAAEEADMERYISNDVLEEQYAQNGVNVWGNVNNTNASAGGAAAMQLPSQQSSLSQQQQQLETQNQPDKTAEAEAQQDAQQQQQNVQLIDSNLNKIADTDVLIPTSNLQKFIENADKILKNITATAAAATNDTAGNKAELEQQEQQTQPVQPEQQSQQQEQQNQKPAETSKSQQEQDIKNDAAAAADDDVALPPSVVMAIKHGSNSNTESNTAKDKENKNVINNKAKSPTKKSVTTAGKTVGVDPTQGIPTRDIYESGHMNEEISVEKLCPNRGADLRVLILITSAQEHGLARLAIRQTWGHYGVRRDVSMAFIVGRTSNESINKMLSRENYIYGDLIRGNFIDSYNNLTLKTISSLEWVDEHCSQAKYILKTDDDMFINVPKLLSFLDAHAKDKRVIYGRLAKKWKPIRNKKSKYYVSTGQFSAAVFPPFTTGPAYLLSSDIVHELYVRSLNQVYLKLEDVYTTGIVAQQLNIKRVHANEFLNRRISFNPCNLRKAISVHMIKANEQFDLWKKLLDQTTKCK